MELTKEQLECLQNVGLHGIMLVPQGMLSICQYLKNEGYIEMVTVFTKDTSKDYPPEELHMNEINIIIQITEKGKAYLASHTKNNLHFRINTAAQWLPIVISIIALLFSIFKG